ncbi:hypothetical protein CANARDRAFT_29493 [[Candida] arabinofermentans NRRL YB-2248]|uniref:Uncharacterized protein n=1 Tax=[Candida] arabinofermentans NRRL YB-2248 TaxID=983967 RepID=A0A1E4SX38_9ASCO|nr:hypothetical protein CANARDRAFT_29493 [[Candida] arabinofermentans NRRL YB-2248]
MSLRKSLYKQQQTRSIPGSSTSSYVNLTELAGSNGVGGVSSSSNNDNNAKYWVKDWYDPIKYNNNASSSFGAITPVDSNSTPQGTPQPSSNGTGNGNGNGNGNGEVKTYGYHFKAWVYTSNPNVEFNDCEDDEKDTLIDLSNYGYMSVKSGNSIGGGDSSNGGVNGSGLTDADIKSAVGGTGGSGLFSSSAAHAMKEEQAKKEEAKVDVETPVETPLETPVEPTPVETPVEPTPIETPAEVTPVVETPAAQVKDDEGDVKMSED